MGPYLQSALIAFSALFTNKTRAFLTMLGIIIGILSVSLMGAAISGVDNVFDDSMKSIGDRVLYIQKYPWFMGNGEWWEFRNRPNLEPEYVDKILEKSKYAEFASASLQRSANLRFRDYAIENTVVEGTNWQSAYINAPKLAQGRYFSQVEDRVSAKVAVIGSEVAINLFPNLDPIGQEFFINSTRVKVIGVLEAQGKFLGLFSQDNIITLPYQTAKNILGYTRHLSIAVKITDGVDLETAKEEIRYIMRNIRKQRPMDSDNFAINQQEAFKQQLDGIKLAITAVGLGITALSLIVGGIGIMNIMFVSVKERTREIGIRKALGARRSVILFQFLSEAVFISFIGGLIGVLLTTGLVGLLKKYFVASLSPNLILIALLVSVITGIVSGIVPANQAAKLDPIESIRHE
ncbi:MAG TPA: FtsX-like permease family protein [Candidatus Marinimicrobia bacterium]|nr:FtsX-like permease family protein [Candidatus Neomarinimicrobiota bacterium]